MCPKSTPDILNDAEWLRTQYATKSTHEIAAMLGVSTTPVRARLHKFGIPMRPYEHQSRRVHECRGGEVARFWSYVDRRGDTECWPWLAGTRNGYGRMAFGGRRMQATHISWQLANGPIPDGLFLCHHCDNPVCVNPAHLFLGSPLDNVRDMERKQRNAVGSARKLSRLTEDDVIAIRRIHAETRPTHAELAARFGVSRSMVGMILSGKSWKHV